MQIAKLQNNLDFYLLSFLGQIRLGLGRLGQARLGQVKPDKPGQLSLGLGGLGKYKPINTSNFLKTSHCKAAFWTKAQSLVLFNTAQASRSVFFAFIQLLNKPYKNEVSLREEIQPQNAASLLNLYTVFEDEYRPTLNKPYVNDVTL